MWGLKKLIFISIVVKSSSGETVVAIAIPIAASAMSAIMPPCIVADMLCWFGSTVISTSDRPWESSWLLMPSAIVAGLGDVPVFQGWSTCSLTPFLLGPASAHGYY